MGHYDDGNHGSNAPGDVEMARSLPAGYLDMIVGGIHKTLFVCLKKIKTTSKLIMCQARLVRQITKMGLGLFKHTNGVNMSDVLILNLKMVSLP